MTKISRAGGVALVCLSAVVFSTAGIFTKGVDADFWAVIFWRGLSAAGFTILYTFWCGTFRNEVKHFGKPGWLVAIFGASGTAAFIPAFKLTSIANVSLIWAAAPFVTALLAWLVLRERPTRKILLSSFFALLGVAFVVGGSFGGVNLTGDFLALWMTLMMAALMVVYRVWPQTPAALPVAMSSLLLLPLALVMSSPLQIAPAEILILIAFGLIFAIASVTLAEGVRRIPAAEAALLSALESPLAPLWAFLIFAAIPAVSTLIGGAIILAAVVWSQIFGSQGRRATGS